MNPKTKKLVILIDVIFNELAAWQWEENVQKTKNLEVHVFLDFQDKSNSFPSMNFEEAPRATSSPTRSSSTALPNLDSYDSNSPPRKLHSLSYVYQSCEFALFASEPQTFEDAAKENVWAKAMDEEIASIERNHTRELVDLPNGRDVTGLKWIYKMK